MLNLQYDTIAVKTKYFFSESRFCPKPFGIEDLNPKINKPGIRSHSRLTAIFLSIFKKITVININNQTIYLNRNSLNAWLSYHNADIKLIDPKKMLEEVCLNKQKLQLSEEVETLPEETLHKTPSSKKATKTFFKFIQFLVPIDLEKAGESTSCAIGALVAVKQGKFKIAQALGIQSLGYGVSSITKMFTPKDVKTLNKINQL